MQCIYRITAPNGSTKLDLSEAPVVNITLLISFGDREYPKHGYLVNILYNLKQDCLRVQTPNTPEDLNHRSQQRPLSAIQDVENLMDFVMLSKTRMISSWQEDWAKFVGGLAFFNAHRQMQSIVNDLKKLADNWNALSYADKVHINKWPVIAEYKNQIYVITNLYAFLNLEEGVIERKVSGVMLERTEDGKFNRRWLDPTSRAVFSEAVEVCPRVKDQEEYFTDRAMTLVVPEELKSKLFQVNVGKYARHWKSIGMLTKEEFHKQLTEANKGFERIKDLNLKGSMELLAEELAPRMASLTILIDLLKKEDIVSRTQALKPLLEVVGEERLKVLKVELTNEERVELGLQPL